MFFLFEYFPFFISFSMEYSCNFFRISTFDYFHLLENGAAVVVGFVFVSW